MSGQPLALSQLYEVLAQPGHRQTINDRLRNLPLTQMRFDQFQPLQPDRLALSVRKGPFLEGTPRSSLGACA
jgi:hypothetical protein